MVYNVTGVKITFNFLPKLPQASVSASYAFGFRETAALFSYKNQVTLKTIGILKNKNHKI